MRKPRCAAMLGRRGCNDDAAHNGLDRAASDGPRRGGDVGAGTYKLPLLPSVALLPAALRYLSGLVTLANHHCADCALAFSRGRRTPMAGRRGRAGPRTEPSRRIVELGLVLPVL